MRGESKRKEAPSAFGDDDVLARRANGFLPDGDYFFQDQFDFKGDLEIVLVICEVWLLEAFEITSGTISFARGAENFALDAAARIGVLYPPFSIAKVKYENAKGNLRGFASRKKLPEKFLKFPRVFEIPSVVNLDERNALEILNSAKDFHPLEMNPNASPRSRQAKKMIDENYLIYPSISRIAQKIGVSPEHLSRQFKADYGISPNKYFNRLRVADAAFLLASGEKIAAVAQDIGYKDLSRFYKQFRQLTDHSPGVCRTILNPEN